MTPENLTIEEPAGFLAVQDSFDVVVCGGGPAGIAAAIGSARLGARTCLVEHQGFLGGVWTAGLLSLILDVSNKSGIMSEIRQRLRASGGMSAERDLYDSESMKLLLEQMCEEAGVALRLYCRAVAAQVVDRKITHVIFEGKEGRFALGGNCFVDTTGDGDLACRAGCGFDIGRDEDGKMQPMTLMALVDGVPAEARDRAFAPSESPTCIRKQEFLSMLREAGIDPSYTQPSLFPLPNGMCALMINHQYGFSGLDSASLTRATVEARGEINRVVKVMRTFSTEWSGLRLVATAPHIGVRDGRRIHGRYKVSVQDLVEGARHEDGVVRVMFSVDVHTVTKTDDGGYSDCGIRSQPYDIPLRALIAKQLDNLLMAGRCISGDFYAHASYRVTGNAVPMGEAAGVAAASSCLRGISPSDLAVSTFLSELHSLRDEMGERPARNHTPSAHSRKGRL